MNERTVFEPRSPGRAGPGTRLNDLYEIDALLAVGGMGEVFRGHAIETGDPVAIKTIRPDFAGNAQALALFRKEAAALRDVHHGAVVRYYVFSIDRRLELPYLAMEFVTGESLADRLRSGALPFEEVEILRRRLAGGLQAAHEAGIVHRDVSPDNVILPDGSVARAKIIDFGIARSATGQTVIGDGFAGKYDYVSPEQLGLQGGDVTGRSDIYSLALVLAQASRGRPVDMGDSPADFIARRATVPDLTGVDSRLCPLLEAMLQPDPKRRPESMAEVEAWRPATSSKGGAKGGGKGDETERKGRGRLLLLGGGGLGLAIAAGVAAMLALQPSAPVPSPRETGTPLSEGTGPGAKPSAPPPEDKVDDIPRTTPPRSDPPPRFDPGGGSPPDRLEPPSDRPGSGGETGTKAPPVRPPQTPPVVVPPPETPPEPPPGSSGMERVAAYIRSYRGGSCFFLNPTTVGAREASVEAYGVDPQPFRVFDAAFRKALGFEARIQLRQIEPGQCAVVDVLATQAEAKPSSVPVLKLDGDRIRSGDELRGQLDVPEGRQIRLLLIEGDGALHDLSPYLKRNGRQASFAIRLEKPASADQWRPQLLVAVASKTPVSMAGGGAPPRAETLFPAIARDAASPDSGLGLAVRYLKVGG